MTPYDSIMTLDDLSGEDPVMVYNARCARRVMNKPIHILLCGETGTGKEAFARAIHGASNRAAKPFVAINCASIPESLIESELFGYRYGAFTSARREGRRGKILQASGGTLFLNDLGDVPSALQIRLLRVLEDKKLLPLGSELPIAVDLHIISATHRDLRALVEAGKFREDLYYRLDGFMLTLPALRERTDRTLVIRRMLAAQSQGQAVDLDAQASRVLNDYGWPGNIRQLRNVLRTAIALCEGGLIRLEDLPAEIARVPPQALAQRCSEPARARDYPAGAERKALLHALDDHRWNITATARRLGLSRNALYRKMKRYGIQKPSPG